MDYFLTMIDKGWVGSLIGLFGILIGIFLYKQSKSIAKPSFQKTYLSLIGNRENNLPSEVTVLYKGQQVNKLTKTTLILWNNGNEVLDQSRVLSADPIKIKFNDGDNILSYEIVKRTKEVNNVQLNKTNDSGHELKLSFEYFDPNDGVIIEILHDSNEKYPKITGTIKGIPQGFIDLGTIHLILNNSRNIPSIIRVMNSRLTYFFGIIIGICLIIFALLPSELKLKLSRELDGDVANNPFPFLFFGLVYALVPTYALWARRRRYPKVLNPDIN